MTPARSAARDPDVSVVLCTVNRAADLKLTLEALENVAVPADLAAEVIIVDNGSTDATPEVARSARLSRMSLRCVVEPRRGVARARNRGVEEARGAAVLFLDDDIRPSAAWLSGMAVPILAGRAEAVAGAVNIAPHLERPWMTDLHRSWLASTVRLDFSRPRNLIGANMALSRETLRRLPPFDVELGAGALGFGEESLLVLQLEEAGIRIAGAPEASVEHHFDPLRLMRGSWLESAKRRGMKAAWLAHHWYRREEPHARRRRWIAEAKLSYWRARRAADLRQAEGCAVWELRLVKDVAYWRHYPIERRREPRYRRASGSETRAAG